MPRAADLQPIPPVLELDPKSLGSTGAELLAVGFTGKDGDYTLSTDAEATLASLGVDAFALLDREQATGAAGETVVHLLSAGATRVAFVGLGAESGRDYRRAGSAVARLGKGIELVATSLGADADDSQLAAICEGLVLGAFGFSRKSALETQPWPTFAASARQTVPETGAGSSFAASARQTVPETGAGPSFAASARQTVPDTGAGSSFAASARQTVPEAATEPPSPLRVLLTEPTVVAPSAASGPAAKIYAGAPKQTLTRADIVARARARALASWRARVYALTPSNEKSPEQLAQWAHEAAERAGLEVDVWDEGRLAAEGFAGILAVGAASAYESRFVRLDYAPAAADGRTPRVVLVGKGITFDTGGISIKPRDGMATMKRDMTGAGVVIAVMGALRELEVPVRVTGLVPSAENAFGGAGMRPGDVVTHYGGRTSEVGNTDAEGRLVLADALAYADANLDPDVVVDIATLTGAGKVALGTSLGALFANDDELAESLVSAGAAAGEPVWRLPLSSEYEDRLESPFADATNAAGGPGAVTAALFLQHFAGPRRWAHLDIASVGDSAKDAFEYTSGATGFGARLLLRWLASARFSGRDVNW